MNELGCHRRPRSDPWVAPVIRTVLFSMFMAVLLCLLFGIFPSVCYYEPARGQDTSQKRIKASTPGEVFTERTVHVWRGAVMATPLRRRWIC